jgi:hypothetical protein
MKFVEAESGELVRRQSHPSHVTWQTAGRMPRYEVVSSDEAVTRVQRELSSVR